MIIRGGNQQKEKYMEKALLEKVRKLNWVLQEAPKGDFSFTDLCEMLSDLTNSNVYVADDTGKVLGYIIR